MSCLIVALIALHYPPHYSQSSRYWRMVWRHVSEFTARLVVEEAAQSVNIGNGTADLPLITNEARRG